MPFPDITPDIKARMPNLRGRLIANQSLAELTWFRVGGPAQAFYMPEDENDLAYFLRNLPADMPVHVVGAGSNLIVRDGGVPGVVIRLGRGFNAVTIEEGTRVVAGCALLDVMVARAARDAGVAGLSFLSGIPGSIGGALRMNGGAYGGETKDVLIEARGVDRQGNIHTYSNAEMGFSYRHCAVPDDVVFTQAVLQSRPGTREEIAAEMDAIKHKREASQPRTHTGGSTFKNPPGHSAWKLVDEAGCRGLKVGDAQVSNMHSNTPVTLKVSLSITA
ncbi:MAG: UDP-N-acetylmuramate dehydrogenase, partial [Pseudolabrys sp.]